MSTEPNVVIGLQYDATPGGDILLATLAERFAAVGPSRLPVSRRIQTALSHMLEAPFECCNPDAPYYQHGEDTFHLKFVGKEQKTYGRASRLTADQLNAAMLAIGDDPVVHVQASKAPMIMQVVVNYSAWPWSVMDFRRRLGEPWKEAVQFITLNRHPAYNHQVFDLFVPHRDQLLATDEEVAVFEAAARDALSLAID